MKKLPSFLVFALLALPLAVQTQQPQTFDGVLETFIEDRYDGTAVTRHKLKLPNGRLDLAFTDGAPDLPPGQVRARGTRQGNTLSLSRGDVQPAGYVVGQSPMGPQRLLIVLMNFADDTSQPESAATVHNTALYEGGVAGFWREASYGHLTISGDVVGYFTIPASRGSCDYMTYAAQADAAAETTGVNVESYNRRMYVFPQTSACQWWGLGQMSGTYSWVNGTPAHFVAAHELGHNFNMGHARAMRFDDGNFRVEEYGDTHDVMGSAIAHPNIGAKRGVGWATPQLVNASGVYNIAPVSGTYVGPRGLWIVHNGRYYYVEYRNNTGYDAWVSPGVLVHATDEFTRSFLWDLDPSGNFDGVLDIGQVFDNGFGVRITTLAQSLSSATVDVVIAGAPPPPPPPPAEVCGNGIDDDGDGLIDEGCVAEPPPPPCRERGKSGKCR